MTSRITSVSMQRRGQIGDRPPQPLAVLERDQRLLRVERAVLADPRVDRLEIGRVAGVGNPFGRLRAIQVIAALRTMARNQGRGRSTDAVSSAFNARNAASCTMSSASAALCDSHLASA